MNSRRDFLKFTGSVTLLPALTTSVAVAGGVAVASSGQAGKGAPGRKKAFEPLTYSGEDEISLAKGFFWYTIASMDQVINAKGHTFGDCCDFTASFTGDDDDHCFLWSNHEYVVPNIVHGRAALGDDKTKSMVEREMSLVGGSLLELRRSGSGKEAGRWKVVADSNKAFRIDANTEIPLVGPAGGRTAKGTMGNCGGGLTPWRSVLSGEENTDVYYGTEATDENYGWGRYFPRPEEDYGWVVEVEVDTGRARKLTALGRFAHEGATFTKAKDGRAVIYMGDDAAGRCLYKFVSAGKMTGHRELDKDLLLEGNLFAADLKAGKWILLAPSHEKLAADEQGRFKTLADILTQTREAAKVAGATALNRPEDVKVHPTTGVVYFALTNNSAAGDFHGQVVMLEETGGDAASTSFTFDTYLAGGPRQGFSCPDNLTFGPGGSLWVCTDISTSSMGKGVHAPFKRNSVLRVENDARTGATFARHFLQGPIEAEITGPSFSLDGKTLFLAIQHPGELSEGGVKGYTSHWPRGNGAKPLSTLIGVMEHGARFA